MKTRVLNRRKYKRVFIARRFVRECLTMTIGSLILPSSRNHTGCVKTQACQSDSWTQIKSRGITFI